MSRCHPESLLLLRDFLQVISALVVGGWSPGMLLLPAPSCSPTPREALPLLEHRQLLLLALCFISALC